MSPVATETTALPTTSNTGWDVIATLDFSNTVVTAYEVPDTTGLAVVDGTTLSWRHEGLTLGNGAVVSLGFNGLVDSTSTGLYETVTNLTGAPTESSPSTHNLTTTHPASNSSVTHTTVGSSAPSGNGTVVTSPPSSGQTSASTSGTVGPSQTTGSGGGSTSSTHRSAVTITSVVSSPGTAASTAGRTSGTAAAASSRTTSSSGAGRLSAGRAAVLLGTVFAVMAFNA